MKKPLTEQFVKEQIICSLKRLHACHKDPWDVNEANQIEGSIIELELLWSNLFGEDIPKSYYE